MKIRASDIRSLKTIAILGDEPWLSSTYSGFPSRRPEERLTGEITLAPGPENAIHVTGRVVFGPHVECSRCAQAIRWTFAADIDAHFEEPNEAVEHKGDALIPSEELDRYFFEDGKIDLAELVREAIQIEVPSRFINATEDGGSCLDCNDDLTSDKVYIDPRDEETSPFAILAKTKH